MQMPGRKQRNISFSVFSSCVRVKVHCFPPYKYEVGSRQHVVKQGCKESYYIHSIKYPCDAYRASTRQCTYVVKKKFDVYVLCK